MFYGMQLLSATRVFMVDSRVELIGLNLEEAGEENGVAPQSDGHENVVV